MTMEERSRVPVNEGRPLKPFDMPLTLGESVAQVLRRGILSGELSHGERLVEAEIARELGISRGPVREAVSQLRGEGLVAEAPRRGAYVVSLSADDVEDVFEIRAALEIHAVRLITDGGDSEVVGDLARIADKIAEAALEGDAEMVGQLDWEFHDSLCRLSGNGRLHSFYRTHAALLQALISASDAFSDVDMDALQETGAEHSVVVDAIKAGDRPQAETALQKHLTSSKDDVLKHLALPKDASGSARLIGDRPTLRKGGPR